MVVKRKYIFNEGAFEEFSPEMAYWLGMMASDGCVYEKRNKVFINAKAEDKEHIESFLRFLDYNYPIKERMQKCKDKYFPTVYVELHSKRLKESLLNLGIEPKKSNKDIDFLFFVPKEYKIYFIFGYFDGDGYVRLGKQEKKSIVSILGNYKFINSVKEFLNKEYLIESFILIDNRSNFPKYELNIAQSLSLLLYSTMYLNFKSGCRLLRKLEKLQEINDFLNTKKEDGMNVGHRSSLYIKKQRTKNCPICGKVIRSTSKTCLSCYSLSIRKVERPSREYLKEQIRKTPFTTLGKQYGVSDKAIEKWCKSYRLPYRHKDIVLINEEDWVNL